MSHGNGDPTDSPLREAGARAYKDRAQQAIEHALPRGTTYVVVLVGPGFNTYGSNVDKAATLELIEGLAQRLRLDLGLATPPSRLIL